MGVGDRRGDRDAEGAADLLRRVQEPGRDAGDALLEVRERGERDRDEGEREPMPLRTYGTKRLRQNVPSGGNCVYQGHAKAVSARPWPSPA